MDILDDFDELKIGVSYRVDGQPINAIPGKWVWLDTLVWWCDDYRGAVGTKQSRGWLHHNAGLEE